MLADLRLQYVYCVSVQRYAARRAVLRGENTAPATKKTFKDYEPSFVHIDIKYLPQMAGIGNQPVLAAGALLRAALFSSL
jgi:hypothetical protein